MKEVRKARHGTDKQPPEKAYDGCYEEGNRMMFSAVPKQVLDVVWEDVKKVLEPAVQTAKGKLSVKDVYDYIKKGVYELWVVMEETKIVAVITTRAIEYPERRAFGDGFYWW